MLKYAVLILWRKKGVPANFYAFCISGLLHLVFSFSVFMFTSPPALELEFVLTAYKDKRLTLDLDQNQGLPPITHSFLFTRTVDFKSLEFGYSRISSKISGGHLVIGELVFRASQHLGHMELSDQDFHFPQNSWLHLFTLQDVGNLS